MQNVCLSIQINYQSLKSYQRLKRILRKGVQRQSGLDTKKQSSKTEKN